MSARTRSAPTTDTAAVTSAKPNVHRHDLDVRTSMWSYVLPLAHGDDARVATLGYRDLKVHVHFHRDIAFANDIEDRLTFGDDC